MANQYRRKEDESLKLLITLSERLNNLQKSLEEKQSAQKEDIKEIEKKQGANPCGVNNIRISHLEKVMWLVAGAVLALIVKTIYFLVNK